MQPVHTCRRLGVPLDQRADLLDVRAPATLGAPVRVRHGHAPAGALSAHFTNCCHDTPSFDRSVPVPGAYLARELSKTISAAIRSFPKCWRVGSYRFRLMTPIRPSGYAAARCRHGAPVVCRSCRPWSCCPPMRSDPRVITFRDTMRAHAARHQPAERLPGARRRHGHQHGPHARRRRGRARRRRRRPRRHVRRDQPRLADGRSRQQRRHPQPDPARPGLHAEAVDVRRRHRRRRWPRRWPPRPPPRTTRC